MANIIRIKRGLEANRLNETPDTGEFLYTTDEKKLYIGDGITAGGNLLNINWNDIVSIPTSSVNDIDDAVGKKHSHANEDVLNNISAAFTTLLETKLDGIESGATADQTKSDIDALLIDAATVNGKTVEASVPPDAVFTDTHVIINDTLTSESITDALSANQGKNLKEFVDNNADEIASIGQVAAPVITQTVYDDNLNVGITTSDYKTTGNLIDGHVSSDFEIATDSEFNNLIKSTYFDQDNKTQYTQTLANEEYYARARHNCSIFRSKWSNVLNLLAFYAVGINTDFATGSQTTAWLRQADGTLALETLPADLPAREGMFLAQTVEDGAELGDELVVNGGFDTDTDWTKEAGWSISDGVATRVSTGANSNIFSIPFSGLSEGDVVRYSMKTSNVTQGIARIYINSALAGGIHTDGSLTGTYTIGSGFSGLYIRGYSDFVGSIDNISVKQVIPTYLDTLPDGTPCHPSSTVSGTKIYKHLPARENSTAYAEGDQVAAEGVVVGDELIANGGFDTDSDWVRQANWGVSNGTASSDGSINGNIQQNIGLLVGEKYVAEYTILSNSGTGVCGISTDSITIQNERSGTGTFQEEFVANNTTFYFRSKWDNFATIDNISVRPVLQSSTDLALTATSEGTSDASLPTITSTDIGSTVTDGDMTWRVDGYYYEGAGQVRMEDVATSIGLNNEDLSVPPWVRDSVVAVTPTNITYVGGLASATTRRVDQTILVDGGTASKSFTVSALVSGTGKFRLKNTHGSVIDNFSSDITATDVPTEYHFTVTNSAEAGSGFQIYGITAASTDDAFDLTIGYLDLEEGVVGTSHIKTTDAPVTRPATLLSQPTEGALRGNDFWIDIVVTPEVDDMAASVPSIFSTFVTASNFIEILTFSGTVRYKKIIDGVVTQLNTVATYSDGIGVRVQAFQSSTYGMGIAVQEQGGGWLTWTTNADTQDAPIADTFEVGSRSGANRFLGDYGFCHIGFSSDPKAALERRRNTVNTWNPSKLMPEYWDDEFLWNDMDYRWND